MEANVFQFTHNITHHFKIDYKLIAVAAILNSVLVSGTQAATNEFSAKTPQNILFDVVTARAKKLAENTYVEPEKIQIDALNNIDYQAYRAIRYRSESAIWHNSGLFELQLFHPGFLYQQPVKIHTVTPDGDVSMLPFDPAHYSYDASAESLQPVIEQAIGETKLGHAGFRIHYPLNTNEYKDEIAVFQGASYFRVVGPNQVYGLSARGLAIDTAEPKGEEFPVFREFWLVKPTAEQTHLVVYALLDSPSVSGAYRFELQPGISTQVKVNAKLFARQDINKLGVAPLTSMFHHGENTNRFIDDFRPEIHDSDGLLVRSKEGQWTWRALTNPVNLRVNSFQYTSPKGFGLLQRDREFTHYLDAEAHYGKRPSLWVEPIGDWGEGRVELVEIPTDTETNDNIVSYWVPEKPFKAGQTREFNYYLKTFDSGLPEHDKAQVVRTRIGWGALPGEDNPPPKSKRQIIVDYKGGALSNLSGDLPLQADLSLSSGKATDITVIRLPDDQGWRVAFKVMPEDNQAIDMRLALTLREQQLSEVWNYVWYANDVEL